MKKLLPVALTFVAAFMFNSCKKEYTCTCKTSLNNVEIRTRNTTIKNYKKNAKDECAEQALSSGGGSTVVTECTLY